MSKTGQLGHSRPTTPSAPPPMRRGAPPQLAAPEALIRRYGGRLLHCARRLLRDERAAREAVQATFLAALASSGGLPDDELRLFACLHGLLLAAALPKLLPEASPASVSVAELLPRFQEDGHMCDPPGDWDDGRQAGRLSATVRECLGRLPDAYRAAYVLRDVEGLDTRDTARLLGWTEAETRQRLHHARLALHTLLDPFLARARA